MGGVLPIMALVVQLILIQVVLILILGKDVPYGRIRVFIPHYMKMRTRTRLSKLGM